MKKFLLVSIPLIKSKQRSYPAAYVAGIIEATGWSVDYIDFNKEIFIKSSPETQSQWNNFNLFGSQLSDTLHIAADVYKNLLSKKELNQYPIIGVGLYSSCRTFVPSFLEALKSLNYTGVIMFGGPDCFMNHYSKRYFDSNLHPDILLHGEAENSLPAFLNEFYETGSYYTKTPGFIYIDDSQTMTDTGVPIQVKSKDLNYIADYSIFTGDHYISILNTFQSRGCINKCTFCNEWVGYTPLRYRDPQTVVEEIKEQQKYVKDCQSISLLESNFNTSIKHVKMFAQTLIDSKTNISWRSMGCFRVELDNDLVALLASSGFKRTMLGFESASQVIIDYMGKFFDVNASQVQIKRLIDSNILVDLPIMNGFPCEATSDFMVSGIFILRYKDVIRVKFAYSNFCYLFGGSLLQKHPEEFGIDKNKVDIHTWETADGLNTFEVRLLRLHINRYLIETDGFDATKLEEFLKSVDFNNPMVAVELAKIIYLLGSFTDNLSHSLQFIAHVADKAPRLQSLALDESRLGVLSNAISGISLTYWIYADKNNDVLSQICEIISEDYKRIKGISYGDDDYINYNSIKSKLYDINGPVRSDHLESFKILNLSQTRYDHGQFIILEGVVWDIINSIPASCVFAEAGPYVIEFLYGLPNPNMSHDSNLRLTGFWGKVKRSYLSKDTPLVIYVKFADGSHIRRTVDIN